MGTAPSPSLALPGKQDGPSPALAAQPLATAGKDRSRTGCLRQGNLYSPNSAQTSQEENQEGPDPAPPDCRAFRDYRKERRNSALLALL